MRTEYKTPEEMEHVLALLTPPNRLVARVMLETGLRVSDVLKFRKEDLAERMTVVEQKTGKKREISLSPPLIAQLRGAAGGKGWCFPGWRDSRKHRTRQAVWKDFRRAAKMLRYGRVRPHSCRKVFAVEHYRENGLEATQEVLNHDNPGTTLLYALADVISKDKHRNQQKI